MHTYTGQRLRVPFLGHCVGVLIYADGSHSVFTVDLILAQFICVIAKCSSVQAVCHYKNEASIFFQQDDNIIYVDVCEQPKHVGRQQSYRCAAKNFAALNLLPAIATLSLCSVSNISIWINAVSQLFYLQRFIREHRVVSWVISLFGISSIL
jgi:hypothetical protein